MTFRSGVKALAACCVAASTTASPAADCGQEHFRPVTTLAALPDGIAALLAQPSALADLGQPYQAGDVVGPERLPFRRFAMAAAGATRTYVAIEVGGRSPPELWWFEHHGPHWTGTQMRVQFEVPRSMSELLFHSDCDGYARFDPQRPRLRGNMEPDGSLLLDYAQGSRTLDRWRLHPSVTASGQRGRDEITNEFIKGERLTARERVALLNLLHARRNSIPDDDPTFEIVNRFLAALETVPPRR